MSRLQENVKLQQAFNESLENPLRSLHSIAKEYKVTIFKEVETWSKAKIWQNCEVDEVLQQALIDEVLENNNFVEEEFQTIERDDLNEAFYGGTQQEAVIAEVIDGHKLIDLENVVFYW